MVNLMVVEPPTENMCFLIDDHLKELRLSLDKAWWVVQFLRATCNESPGLLPAQTGVKALSSGKLTINGDFQ